MYPQQVRGPVPLQVSGPTAYLPQQSSTSSLTDIMDSMMPMLMMVVMLAMIMPLMKNMTAASNA